MISDEQYERNELNMANRQENEINNAPLSDRKEACAEFLEAMKTDPALVAERIGWLVDGNYGYGQMIRAKRIISNKRLNRKAGLTHLVGIFEWQCPAIMSSKAWNKLTKSEQKTLDAAVEVVIDAAEKDQD